MGDLPGFDEQGHLSKKYATSYEGTGEVGIQKMPSVLAAQMLISLCWTPSLQLSLSFLLDWYVFKWETWHTPTALKLLGVRLERQKLCNNPPQ